MLSANYRLDQAKESTLQSIIRVTLIINGGKHWASVLSELC